MPCTDFNFCFLVDMEELGMISAMIGYSSGILALDFVADFIMILVILLLMFGFIRSLINPRKGGIN